MRSLPRRAPNQDRPPSRVRVAAPGSTDPAIIDRTGRTVGRGTAGRTGAGRAVARGGGAVNRRPPGGNVVGRAVPRSTLQSRPIIINNYANAGRRSSRGYTRYSGRHYYDTPIIYGSYFYFPGYSTFGTGIGYGSSYYSPYWNGYYGHSYGYTPYAYPYGGYDYTGSLRLKVKPRFGEVYVDGYYVGLVNDFDGIFQALRLEEGPHHIEIHDRGFAPLAFEVYIVPGQKITYEGNLARLP